MAAGERPRSGGIGVRVLALLGSWRRWVRLGRSGSGALPLPLGEIKWGKPGFLAGPTCQSRRETMDPDSSTVRSLVRARLVTKNFHPKIFTSPLNTCMKH